MGSSPQSVNKGCLGVWESFKANLVRNIFIGFSLVGLGGFAYHYWSPKKKDWMSQIMEDEKLLALGSVGIAGTGLALGYCCGGTESSNDSVEVSGMFSKPKRSKKRKGRKSKNRLRNKPKSTLGPMLILIIVIVVAALGAYLFYFCTSSDSGMSEEEELE